MNAYLHASVKQIIAAVEGGLLSRGDAAAICAERLERNPEKATTTRLAEWLASEKASDTKAKPAKPAKPAAAPRPRDAKGHFVKQGGQQAKPQAQVATGWTPEMLVALRALKRLTDEQAMTVIAEAMA